MFPQPPPHTSPDPPHQHSPHCWPNTGAGTQPPGTDITPRFWPVPDKHHNTRSSYYSLTPGSLVLVPDVGPLRICTTGLQNSPESTHSSALPPPLRLVFPHLVPQHTLAQDRREWPSLDTSLCHRSSPSLCSSPFPWKLGITPGNKSYLKTCRAYLVSSESWSYKARGQWHSVTRVSSFWGLLC